MSGLCLEMQLKSSGYVLWGVVKELVRVVHNGVSGQALTTFSVANVHSVAKLTCMYW